MLVIVGHGPSVVSAKLGSWLDTQTVVRLKDCPYWKGKEQPEVWGTRIDFLCGTKLDWRVRYYQKHGTKPDFWLFDKEKAWRFVGNHPRRPERHLMMDNFYPNGVFKADTDRWMKYFFGFDPVKPKGNPKPSLGLCALFCAAELGYKSVGVIGFDSFFTDSPQTGKWNADQSKQNWVHDQRAEQAAMNGLGMEIVNLGDPDRQRPANGS